MKAIRFESNNGTASAINYYLDKGWTIFSIISDMAQSHGGNGSATYTESFLVIFNKNGIEL